MENTAYKNNSADGSATTQEKPAEAVRAGQIKARKKSTARFLKVLMYGVLIFWALVNLFPMYWMFTFSLKDNPQIFGLNPVGLPTPWNKPQEWHWENYTDVIAPKGFGFTEKEQKKVDTYIQKIKTAIGERDKKEFDKNWNNLMKMYFSKMPMGFYFFNSIFVTVMVILLVIIAALMATFGMTRIKWRFSSAMNSFLMLGITIPIHASILPVFYTLKTYNMLNKYSTLIIPYAAFSLAMAILICTGFMNDIPKELDESARIDGCGYFGTFFKIICPLMKSALATIAIYTFLQCWNELMFANVLISNSMRKTLPIGIQELHGQHLTNWGPIGAALVVATFPTLIAYVIMSKNIQDSFIAGAIKG